MSGTHKRDEANTDPGTLKAELAERVGQWAGALAQGTIEGLQIAQRLCVQLQEKARTPEGRAGIGAAAAAIVSEIERRQRGA